MTSTAITVLDYTTGEVIDVHGASNVQLAEFVGRVKELREALTDAEALVSDELVSRLDKNGCWTERVGDPLLRQWEITAPSPTAGTEAYPETDLERELSALVERGTISPDGADRALDRLLVVTCRVPLKDDLDLIASEVTHAPEVQIAGVTVDVLSAAAVRKARKAGINALRKVPGTTAALDRAKVTTPVGARRASVKQIGGGQ